MKMKNGERIQKSEFRIQNTDLIIAAPVLDSGF